MAFQISPEIISKVGSVLGNKSSWGDFFKKQDTKNSIGSGISNIVDFNSQSKADDAKVEAYQNYLNYLHGLANQMGSELEARAGKYDTKLQDMQKTGEEQFANEANTQLAELGQLVQDISDESAEAQRQNARQVNAELARQGVRGGQAGILANRATGELNRDLQRDINQTVYDEAAKRQDARLNYFGQKGLTPWSDMAQGYASSMADANKYLSAAQGNVYAKAYDNAMSNYMNAQQKKEKGGLGSKIGSVAGGVIGSYFGPIGSTIGSAAGSYIGGKIGGK